MCAGTGPGALLRPRRAPPSLSTHARARTHTQTHTHTNTGSTRARPPTSCGKERFHAPPLPLLPLCKAPPAPEGRTSVTSKFETQREAEKQGVGHREAPSPVWREGGRQENDNVGLSPRHKIARSSSTKQSPCPQGVRGKEAQTTRSVSYQPCPNFCCFLSARGILTSESGTFLFSLSRPQRQQIIPKSKINKIIYIFFVTRAFSRRGGGKPGRAPFGESSGPGQDFGLASGKR